MLLWDRTAQLFCDKATVCPDDSVPRCKLNKLHVVISDISSHIYGDLAQGD